MSETPANDELPSQLEQNVLSRRKLLLVGGISGMGVLGAGLLHKQTKPKRPGMRASVFIARAKDYDADLQRIIRDGLMNTGFEPQRVRGKKVLLKPNLVEPIHTSPQMTTNPRMVVAAADVFRQWGADVQVGEGPGHVRDTELTLVESRMLEPLDDAELKYVDLNFQEFAPVRNAGKASVLAELCLPRGVHEADFVVSMPKLKTHHWIGFTAAMKNLYGVMPGIRYGWPKNVLHHAGIPQTVFDINASLPKTLAIVDAITCMEGDGPIMGGLKHMGLVVVGTNLPAVDATCARIMGLLPERAPILQLAADRLGPIQDEQISQRGERWQPLVSPFEILDYPHLQYLKAARPGGVLTSFIDPASMTPCQRRRLLHPCQATA